MPTVAGLLLFGTTRALRRHFPMMRVDYAIRVPGRTWVSNPDRRFDTIEMRGPLVQDFIGRIASAISVICRPLFLCLPGACSV